MKETLKQRIEDALQKAKDRMVFLESSLQDYIKHQNYESALKTQIKLEQTSLFIGTIEKILE